VPRMLLASFFLLFAVRCSLLSFSCQMFAVSFFLLAVRCSLFAVRFGVK
jgi:hypothetical protein